MKLGPHHPHHSDDALKRLLAARFASASMSDAKWFRLLSALSGVEGLVLSCTVKLVWDDVVRSLALSDDSEPHFDFWSTAVEAMVSGHPRGWYSYNEFEWIAFPPTAERARNPDNLKSGTDVVTQDVAGIAKVIAATGQFDTEWLADGSLRLYGYRAIDR